MAVLLQISLHNKPAIGGTLEGIWEGRLKTDCHWTCSRLTGHVFGKISLLL
jgi:hypothetical protein